MIKKKKEPEKPKGKPGTKPKVINWDLVEKFLLAGSNQKRICGFLSMDEKTLRSHVLEKYGEEWSVFSSRLYSQGESLIEHVQYEKAMEGNPTMLQWVGKVRLGQREPENTQSLAPNQQGIYERHENMRLQYENEVLRLKLEEYEKNKT